MSDVEKSFTFLHDNIPQWFKDIAEVEEKIVNMQDELAKIPMSESRPLRRKTGSMESIRDLDAVPEDTGAPATSSPTTRKRKTPSIMSGRASGQAKFRSRTMIVVYYDGQIQKSFEQLVRAIGTGRNMLRKGKMAAKMEAMIALAGSDDDDDDDTIMSKIGYRHRAGLSSMRTRTAALQNNVSDNSTTSIELYESSDKALEQAQTLCEKAAHLSLREGDCRKELDTVRNHLEEVLVSARKEVARYAARKEKEEQQAARQDSKVEQSTPAPTPIPEPKRLEPTSIPSTNSTTHAKTMVMDIEVDDDDDEDDLNFVMPPIRLTSRA